MLTGLSKKDLEDWWTCGRQKNAKRGWEMGGNLSNLTWQKIMCCSDHLWIRTAKKGGTLIPWEQRIWSMLVLKKINLLVASHCCCWIWVRYGAELQFRCIIDHSHHGHWAKEQQGKGRAKHSGDCGYLHGVTGALGEKSSNVLKNLIFSLVNVRVFFFPLLLGVWIFQSYVFYSGFLFDSALENLR